MKGDFSRDTFSPHQHYSAVLMQQGRVQVDADWNEQRAIDRHRTETEARDLIGPGGGQVGNAGFEIRVRDKKTLSIGRGNLYVDGILCQNEGPKTGDLLFENQEDLPGPQVIDILKGDPEVGLVYLDVWERYVTSLDDDHIREVALGGPDTATRSRTVWQAKVLRVKADTSKIAALQPLVEKHVETVSKLEDSPEDADELRFTLAHTDNRILELLGVDCESPFEDEIQDANPPSTGQLAAQALPPARTESRCAVPPSAGYERLENQLYRVEIHQGGERDAATFKWSRDNGSVETAVLSVTPRATITEIVVRDLGRDEPLGFANGQYVELIDDSREEAGEAGPLVQIISDINPTTRTIIVNEVLTAVGTEDARDFHYKLRRWDSIGALEMPSDDEDFVELEGSIEVRFTGDHFNTGDYWLIPARTATGQIEWPYEDATVNGQVLQRPVLRPPAGIEHHYSRLALVMAATVNKERQLLVLSDCRRLFPRSTGLTGLFYLGGDGQEAGSGQPLPRPLVVGVANGDRPVLGARVRFEVQAENLVTYDGKLEAEGNAGKSVTVTTNARGEAICSWTLATKLPSQQVRASLLDGTHLPVYFNANLSAAGEDVAQSIQIMKLLLANRQDLRVDSNVPVDALAEGIQVVCDENSIIDEQTVQGRPTCFITLEMPWPQNEPDMEIWGRALVGFRPLILAAKVDAERNVILWRPAEDTGVWLRDTLFQRVREGTERILAHLTLKGNFIWDKERPDAYVDGEVFGIPRGADIDLRFPSGDGRSGGDFETWFWLVEQTLILDSVKLDRDRVTGGTPTMMGTVRILGTAPVGGASVKLASSNPGVVTVPGGVRIEAGGSSAPFELRTVAVGADTPVTITATLQTQQGSMQKFANLIVQPPVLKDVSLNPPTVTGRAPVQGAVTLTGPAPTGGINVSLRADPNVVKIQQSSVTVPANSSTAGFTVNTEPVSSPTLVAITATLQTQQGSMEKRADLIVQPPALTELTLSPPSLLGGFASQGKVQLSGPAPANFTVNLRSTNTSMATVQQSVTVPANSDSATFAVNALPVTSTRGLDIVASLSGVDRVKPLTVQSPVPADFTFTPPRIGGGKSSTGTVKLNGPAPGGTSITLSSGSNTITANFPTTVSVQANATQVTFQATGKTFTGADRSVAITASYLGGTRPATLTVEGGKSKEKDKDEKEHKDNGHEVPFAPGLERRGEVGPARMSGKTGEPGGTDDDNATSRAFIRPEERPELGRRVIERLTEEKLTGG
jgi:hypothetical protein